VFCANWGLWLLLLLLQQLPVGSCRNLLWECLVRAMTRAALLLLLLLVRHPATAANGLLPVSAGVPILQGSWACLAQTPTAAALGC
jgi:hypothetical protein